MHRKADAFGVCKSFNLLQYYSIGYCIEWNEKMTSDNRTHTDISTYPSSSPPAAALCSAHVQTNKETDVERPVNRRAYRQVQQMC